MDYPLKGISQDLTCQYISHRLKNIILFNYRHIIAEYDASIVHVAQKIHETRENLMNHLARTVPYWKLHQCH